MWPPCRGTTRASAIAAQVVPWASLLQRFPGLGAGATGATGGESVGTGATGGESVGTGGGESVGTGGATASGGGVGYVGGGVASAGLAAGDPAHGSVGQGNFGGGDVGAGDVVASSATSAHAGVVSPGFIGARSRSPLWVRWHVAALTLPRELPPSQLERQSRRLPRHRKPLWKFQNLKFQQWGAANCGSESCGQGRSAVDNAGRPIRGFWNSGIDTTHRARSAGFRDFSGGGDSAVVAAGSGSGPITTSQERT